MSIGKQIRKYRNLRNLFQKDIANKIGSSDSAVRNYELGNRIPSQDQINDIAAALNINPAALTAPDFDTIDSIMHALFALEENNHIQLLEINGSNYLTFDDSSSKELSQCIAKWFEKYEAYQKGLISEAEYIEWKAMFPS
jgi:transcriptional regulator with XRE-family HTH domain